MSYRIAWRQAAMERLAHEYNQLTPVQKRRVLTALDDFDHLLETEPLLENESRGTPHHRASLRGPLLVAFWIDEETRLVRIIDARLHRPGLPSD